MITILLGTDQITKQKYLAELLTEKQLEPRKFRSGDALPRLDSLSEPTLFGPASAYIFDHCWKDLDPEALLAQVQTPAHIVIIEESIDQRKTVNKNILHDKKITVKDFSAPNGPAMIGKWLTNHAEELGVAIDKQAVTQLTEALVPEENGALPVLQAHQELIKLKQYSGGEIITAEMVQAIVPAAVSIDIFSLLNAIGSKNKTQSLQLLEKFFAHSNEDDKAAAIQFSALLAEQLRSVLLVKDAVDRRIPDSAILASTGWKSGRLYNVKKAANHFSFDQIRQTLAKLESLDMELKTSTMPPHVILDVIIGQL